MTCFFPLTGHQAAAGAPLSFSDKGFRVGSRRVVVPCGQCRGCRIDFSRAWALRCVHEASLYEHNSFVTLTYAEDRYSLCPRDLQLFMKRLRKVFSAVRFYACGEYGELRGRAHYHLLLFNVFFEDRYFWRSSEAGFRLYRSPVLEKLWPLGQCEIGDVSFESAAYCARYVMKKELGAQVTREREIWDVTCGELVTRVHEFSRMSLKPGIGSAWLERFKNDVYPEGRVYARGGVGHKAPKFYDKRFAVEHPDLYEQLVARRLAAADDRFDDNSPRRLRVKSQVLDSKIVSLKRRLG